MSLCSPENSAIEMSIIWALKQRPVGVVVFGQWGDLCIDDNLVQWVKRHLKALNSFLGLFVRFYITISFQGDIMPETLAF